MLVLLVMGALADAPVQARLLTPDELEEAPVTELSMSQLEVERARLEKLPAVWPSWALLGFGIAGSFAATVLGVHAIATFSKPRGTFDMMSAVATAIVAAVLGVQSAAVGITGGGLLPIFSNRRALAVVRRREVATQLYAISTGRAVAALPEPRAYAGEVQDLVDERPGYILPLILQGAGLALAAGGGASFAILNQSLQPNTVELAMAIAVTCAGVLLGGVGIYRSFRVPQERSELARQIVELQALPQPIAVDDYWHF